MRALVTGAGGFVGEFLVDHLEASGDEVHTTDHAELDILDAGGVRDRLGAVRPEAVYHLAGQSDVAASWEAPRQTFRVNAEGTLNVLAAAAAAGVRRVLIVGSADMYGKVAEDELPLTEESPLRPVSPYAASKVAADFLGLQMFLAHGLEVLRVRAFNHLGPGQTDKFVAAALAARIARNEVSGAGAVRVGNLEARRDFTDVRDVCRAYRLLVERGEPGEAYNVCSGRAVSVQELADTLIGMAERPMRLVPDPELMRPVDVPVHVGDHAKLTAATGWEPEIPLEDTLADLLAAWRERARAEVA